VDAAALEARVLEAVNVPGLTETLRELIAYPSVGGEERAIQERMALLLEEAGMAVDRWEIDVEALRADPAYCTEVERQGALGVVGRAGRGEGPTLVLNGHVDVVPAGDPERWSSPPWEGSVRDGRVYGRGAADMKGGLCCALYAVRALREAGVTPRGTLLLQSVVGEEDGGMGTLAAIRRGHLGDAAVVLEPTQLVVAPAQAGALNFRVTVPGLAAHGALRAEGVSPIEKFIPIHEALLELERSRNERARHPLFSSDSLPFALCVGTVRAGIWASTVAEFLTFEGRLGMPPGESPEEARRELEAAVLEAAAGDRWLRDHPPKVEWWGGQFAPASIPADHPLVGALSEAFRSATGRRPHVRGMPYGADMRLLVHEGGVPTVLFGPGDVRHAHAPNEFVPIAELESATRTLALLALRFCGV